MRESGANRDFWSRRRAAVEAEARAEAAATARESARAEEERLAALSDEEILAKYDLPEPEALETSEQVQAFLKASLPVHLRNRALRRLWRMNPVLANLDGLVDYGDDYTGAERMGDAVQTAYKVGRGLMDRVAAPEVPDEAPGRDIAAEGTTGEDAGSDMGDVRAFREDIAAAVSRDDSEEGPAPQRRMRFRFEAAT